MVGTRFLDLEVLLMRRVLALLALMSSVALVGLAAPSDAQTIPPTTPPTTAAAPPDLAVTGVVACSTQSIYTITWTLTDTSPTTVEFMGGVMSGAATGSVEFSPSVINPGQTMTGVAAVPGATTGTVTLTLSTLIGDLGAADYTGSVQLEGTCQAAAPAPQTQAAVTYTG
jgi:hypothetical protein